MNSNRGFTLVELMIAIAVSMLLLTALYGAVNSVQRSSTGIERRIEAQQAVKPALDLMSLEITMASF
ncbi:MAG: prepilin-type N-terminal cleavage/methylation domain-containing protein, partial [Syntrophales bacterium]|nr:prepilin-type N-terminal cleavage/methylation domain-containing protein [Syntrophales bacterium]